MPAPSGRHRAWGQMVLSYLVFHFLRRFPAWAGWLPAHQPALKRLGGDDATHDATHHAGAQPLSDTGPRQLS